MTTVFVAQHDKAETKNCCFSEDLHLQNRVGAKCFLLHEDEMDKDLQITEHEKMFFVFVK